MKTYELCNLIKDAIIRRTAEVIVYTNWSDEFALSQIREIPDWIKQSEHFEPVQPSELTASQCDSLGFGKLSVDSPQWLIPLWLLPFLAEEIKLNSIDGKTIQLKSEMDTDTRYGSLAYGVTPCT